MLFYYSDFFTIEVRKFEVAGGDHLAHCTPVSFPEVCRTKLEEFHTNRKSQKCEPGRECEHMHACMHALGCFFSIKYVFILAMRWFF